MKYQCEQIITEPPWGEGEYGDSGPQHQCPREATHFVHEGTGYVCAECLAGLMKEEDIIDPKNVRELKH